MSAASAPPRAAAPAGSRTEPRATHSRCLRKPGWHRSPGRSAPTARGGEPGEGRGGGGGGSSRLLLHSKAAAPSPEPASQLAPWHGCAGCNKPCAREVCRAHRHRLPGGKTPSPAAGDGHGTSFKQSRGVSSSSTVPWRGLALGDGTGSGAPARRRQTAALCSCGAAPGHPQRHQRIPPGVPRLCREDIKHPLLSGKGQHRTTGVTAKTRSSSGAARARCSGSGGFTPAPSRGALIAQDLFGRGSMTRGGRLPHPRVSRLFPQRVTHPTPSTTAFCPRRRGLLPLFDVQHFLANATHLPPEGSASGTAGVNNFQPHYTQPLLSLSQVK